MSWIFIIEHTMHKEYVFVLNPKYFQILWQKRFISNVAVYPKLRRPKNPYFFQFYDKSLIHIYFGPITLFVFVYCYSFYYFTLALPSVLSIFSPKILEETCVYTNQFLLVIILIIHFHLPMRFEKIKFHFDSNQHYLHRNLQDISVRF